MIDEAWDQTLQRHRKAQIEKLRAINRKAISVTAEQRAETERAARGVWWSRVGLEPSEPPVRWTPEGFRTREFSAVQRRATMTKQEWEQTLRRQQSQAATSKAKALLQRLHNNEPRRLAEMAQRRKQREVFNEPALPQRPTTGQQRVMESNQQLRPTFDPATQAMWDNWLDARCEALIRPRLKKIVEAIAEKANANTKTIDKNIKGLDADMVALRDKFRTEIATLRKEFAGLVRKLRSDNSKLRAEMKLQSGIASGHVAQLPAFLRGTSNGK
jgi:hypothetical protein